jgi:hypothetical protein
LASANWIAFIGKALDDGVLIMLAKGARQLKKLKRETVLAQIASLGMPRSTGADCDRSKSIVAVWILKQI